MSKSVFVLVVTGLLATLAPAFAAPGAPVPEPGSVAMLVGAGVAGLAVAYKLRRRR